jgi:hypothetical protein
MLERASSRRSIAIAFTLTAMAIDPEAAPEIETHWGMIEASSFRLDAEGYHFQLRGTPHEIVYAGALPKDVCVGTDAVVEGTVEGERFVATRVARPTCIKGNPCRPYACLPLEERPVECRPDSLRFE